jgi:type IV secretion system protein VirB10
MGIKFPFFRKRNTEEHDLPEDAEPDHIEGERAIPSVNKGLTLQTRLTNFLLFGLVIGLAVFMLYKYYADLFAKKAAAEEAAKIDTKSNMVSVLPPLNAPAPPPGPPAAVPAVYTPPANGAPPPPPGAPAGPAGPQQPKPLTQAEINFNRRLAAPVMFKVGNDRTAAAGQGEGAAGAAGAAGAPGSPPGGAGAGGSGARSGAGGPLGESLQPTYTPGVRAELLPDRNFMLTQATHIECTMPEALDTTHPGMVSCVQGQDAFSDNGAVVLLEKGTVYTGEMKRALLNGQKRAFMVWTRAKTPNGVIVKLDSPATDELGRTGVTGEIDTHFWERFGNAILVSLIDDVGAAVIANQTKGGNNNTVALPNTVQGSQSVMSDVLKMTGDIPPTLRRNQAGIINIYVARDLDFRSVYGIREKR